MGLLRVKGTIDINQFWPTGKSPNVLSDADTVHVEVDPASSFVFEGNVTRAFDFAWIKTQKKKPIYVIASQTKPTAHIKVRFQGIDAPELHYRVDQKKPEVRQHWGKRAAFELRKFLGARANGGKIDCHVETLVKSPNDVFDMYGRFIGEIIISGGSGLVNVNHWLVKNGWAFPAHYNSMMLGEIDAINALWATAKNGFLKTLSKRATNAMYGLPAGKAGDPPSDASQDKGPVAFPKMFRRLVAFQEDPNGATTLDRYLVTKKKDVVIRLDDFRKLTPAQRAHPTKAGGVPLVALHTLVASGNQLSPKPETLVFVESAAVLKNSTGKVTSWGEQGVPVATVP